MYYAQQNKTTSVEFGTSKAIYWKFENKQTMLEVCSAKPGMYPCKKPAEGVEVKEFSHAEPLVTTVRLHSK